MGFDEAADGFGPAVGGAVGIEVVHENYQRSMGGVEVMGTHPIDFAVDFTLERQHTFRMRRISGLVSDIYEIYVDEHLQVQARVGIFDSAVHSQKFVLDGMECEIRWQGGWLSGDPKHVAVLSEGRVLALYGEEQNRGEVSDSSEGSGSAEAIERVKLVKVTPNARSRETVGSEQVRIDNRSGSDSVSRRTHVSKTIEKTLTTSKQRSVDASISAKVLSVVEAQLAQTLTWDSSHQIGEAITSSEEVELSVKGGDAVVYELTWTMECESGEAEFKIGGSRHVVSYEARYGLEMSITSRSV